ncbi:ribosomal protein S18 acetylase RimI-like enzyme [Enterococcus sp. PF1-24]|uniref:GNAT family N-acetyltransferase n=1 Tax=unclassified Enterococcus TaxID=2608891 RepID=UPI00247688FB|nr:MULTISPECIES: GNAT family N-acetyltransferase [unclassified Enterococcus]MDH6364987.1 ribosomal protein S18 acetylase RimI-like enzyme [Enterococcus sp. PFB1-1]MDH6402088.1 ribosomal protein S18 acetylase RimI-like enzyme [Enterococcus sp. PF1-24]
MAIKELPKEQNSTDLISLLESHQLKEKAISATPKADFSYGFFDGEQYLGGITANVFMNTMHVQLLAVAEEVRGKAIGQQLLHTVEAEATKLKCTYITIHTQDYQALTFYQKFGYQVFGQLPDMPFTGTTKYYLYKRLDKADA